MRRYGVLFLVVFSLTLAGFFLNQKKVALPLADTTLMSTFTLTSEAFEHNEEIPPLYTCDGENVNPPLRIQGTPDGTESLALIVDDLDAPGRTFTHWILWNVPATMTVIPEDSLAEGETGMGSTGTSGYHGPCPPTGAHRYFFKLYALDTNLTLSSDAEREDLERAMEGHIIEETHLMGLYRRQEEVY